MASKEYNIMGYDGNSYFVNKTVTSSSLYTLAVPSVPFVNTLYKGKKQYELSNHLGNVLVTISDRKIAVDDNADLVIDYYNPDIMSVSDYYAFGNAMPGRSLSVKGYRYGFNNQEKDEELGDYYAFEYRIHDARLGRFLSVDPLAAEYPWNSTYAFAENRVIDGIDLEGREFLSANSTKVLSVNRYAFNDKFDAFEVVIINQNIVNIYLHIPDFKLDPSDFEEPKTTYEKEKARLITLGQFVSNKRVVAALKSKWPNKNPASLANFVGSIATLLIDIQSFTSILADIEYNKKYESELGVMANYLDAATRASNIVNSLVIHKNKALASGMFDTENGERFFADVINYMVDGTIPEDPLEYKYGELVKQWALIYMENETKILSGSFNLKFDFVEVVYPCNNDGNCLPSKFEPVPISQEIKDAVTAWEVWNATPKPTPKIKKN